MKTLVEKNRLIAEWLYPEMLDKEKIEREGIESKGDMLLKFLVFSGDYERIKIHESWSSLMKIVEKIEYELSHPFHIMKSSVVIKQNNTISSPSIINHSNNPTNKPKKDAIFDAIFAFVEWDNNQKNNGK
jgi:hypothetical protein